MAAFSLRPSFNRIIARTGARPARQIVPPRNALPKCSGGSKRTLIGPGHQVDLPAPEHGGRQAAGLSGGHRTAATEIAKAGSLFTGQAEGPSSYGYYRIGT